MSTPDIAREYISRGWQPIPIPHKAKRPVLTEWEKLRIAHDDVPKYFNGVPQNIGVLLGKTSNWLVDLDMDWPEVARLARHFCPPTLTFGRASSRGSHALVRCVDSVTKKFQFPEESGGMVLELRSTGTQTVFPGSAHKDTGELIEFENKAEVVEIPRDKLETICAQWASAAVLLRYWTPGHRDELAATLAALLLRAGWTAEGVNQYIEIIATEAGDEAVRDRLKACAVEKAIAKGAHTYGFRNLSNILGGTIAEKLREWLQLGKTVEELQGFPIELVLSAADLLARNISPREFIVDEVLTLSSLAMLYGWRGLGKTWVTLDMALAVASGSRWLKWPVVKARRVLYVDGEMPAADLQARVRALCGDDVPDLLDLLPSEFFYAAEQRPFTLNDIEHQTRLRLLLEQLAVNGRRPELIVFDNLSSMSFGTDENSNSEQDSALAFLRALRHLGHALVLVHHAGKGGDQRGASRHEDFLDLSIKLAKPDTDTDTGDAGAHFILEFVKVRGKMPQPATLDCSLATDQHGRLGWTFAVDREPAKWVQALKFVADKAPQTQKEVAEALGISAAAAGKHLQRARERQLLDGMVVTDSGAAYLKKVYSAMVESSDDEPDF